MATLKIRDNNGNVIPITSIKGEKGDKGDSGTTDYNDLENKPFINGQELVGNITLDTKDEIYVGSDEPDGYALYIDPTGEASGIVEDVMIHGASIVTDGKANIPLATKSSLGIVGVNASMGIDISNVNGTIYVAKATNEQIDAGTNEFKPIVPKNFDYAYLSARRRLDNWEIIAEVTLEEEVNSIFIDKDKNGEPFKLKKVRIWSVFVQNQDNKSEWVRWHANNNDIQFNIPNVLPSGNNKNTYVDVYMEKCDGYTDVKYFGPTTQTNDNRSYGQTIQHLTSFILLNNATFENVTVKSNQPTVNIGAGTKILVMGVRE